MTTIRTYSGLLFDLQVPVPMAIEIGDIAHALSMIPRFGGHTSWPWPYSVAQHSLQVARRCPPELALEGLLHDAAEAYIGDITRPLKGLLGDRLKPIETAIERTIALKFELAYPWPEPIKQADNVCLAIEQTTFWPGSIDSSTGQIRDLAAIPEGDRLHRLMPSEVKGMFLECFNALSWQRHVRRNEAQRLRNREHNGEHNG